MLCRRRTLSPDIQPRSQGLSLMRDPASLKGGRLRLLLSILSLQDVKCCHQNKHFFHVAPVCCITVMSQCNTVQTPKKICTVDKILLRNNPPCGFGLSPRSRDQPQPGSLFSRSWGRGERDPRNEVAGHSVRPQLGFANRTFANFGLVGH